jgi:hypothetical protein
MKRTPKIDRDLWEIDNPNVLIDEVQSLVPQESQNPAVWTTVLPKLQPILLGLSDFAAIYGR